MFRFCLCWFLFIAEFLGMRFNDSKDYSRAGSPFYNNDYLQRYGFPISSAVDNNHNELIPFHVISNDGTVTLVNDFRTEPEGFFDHRRRRHRRKRVYSDWSDWNGCDLTRCTTVRQRHCVRPNICGSDVVTEWSYCFTEGSRCPGLATDRTRSNDRSLFADNAADNERASVNFTCGVATTFAAPTKTTSDTGRMIKKITGGRETEKFRWPWQVAVLNGLNELICGGTLVAPGWVLTAAHCSRKMLTVRLREYDLFVDEGDEIEARVERVIVHPRYNPNTIDNDMALLKLRARDLETNGGADDYLQPACLPVIEFPRPKRKPYTVCVVVGWGKARSRDSYGSRVLQEARVPMVGRRTCRAAYRRHPITDNMLCAGYRDGRSDTCAGDSGGPLLCRTRRGRWTVVGVTSFGDGCGRRGKYGIYASVANGVRWIASAIDTAAATRRREMGREARDRRVKKSRVRL